jgi:hypothetical protein
MDRRSVSAQKTPLRPGIESIVGINFKRWTTRGPRQVDSIDSLVKTMHYEGQSSPVSAPFHNESKASRIAEVRDKMALVGCAQSHRVWSWPIMLTTMQIRAIKPAARPKIPAGGEFYLLVQSSGSLLWRFRHKVFGTDRKLSIGSFPDVSPLQARHRRDEARAEIEGVDPVEEKRQRITVVLCHLCQRSLVRSQCPSGNAGAVVRNHQVRPFEHWPLRQVDEDHSLQKTDQLALIETDILL